MGYTVGHTVVCPSASLAAVVGCARTRDDGRTKKYKAKKRFFRVDLAPARRDHLNFFGIL